MSSINGLNYSRKEIIATIKQRLSALEKLVKATIIKPVQFIVMDIEEDDPEEYGRKQRQITALEAAGNKVIVYKVV